MREHPALGGRGVVNTNVACPLCAKEKRTTVGGFTPTLRKLEDGSDPRSFCHTHGYITEEEQR